MTAYLAILSHRDAIRWVLAEQRMAFPSTPRAEVRALAAGDRLYLYATRGAMLNPTRDRGRIIATATATAAVRVLDEPVSLAGRVFASGCPLTVEGVVLHPGGLELQPLVNQLAAFPKPDAWSAYMRRPLLGLAENDVALLDKHLTPMLVRREEALATYP
ncbi:hypothetical protein ACFQY4_35045 [Catellatospora bangladeshensis]|uniref:hypothetical protein n=1 Tax=Catellatospora bangladeshensis TaxID=310355 RepID=UPI001941CE57|nr:hypothetical protein [Catellatospora bangladeshensis]